MASVVTRVHWPEGDSGRCEMTTADSHDMQAEASAELMEKYEKALIEINNLNETISDLRTDLSSLESQHQQVQKDSANVISGGCDAENDRLRTRVEFLEQREKGLEATIRGLYEAYQ